MKIFVTICAFLAFTVISPPDFTNKAFAQNYQTLVGVDTARLEPLSRTAPVLGTLVAKRSGDIAVEVGGAVTKLMVAIGDRVSAGQVIAELDSETRKARRDVLRAELQEAYALLKIAEADLAAANQNMNRQAKLKKTGAFNRSLFETTQQVVARALAQISRAKAAIASKKAGIRVLDIEISKAHIASPYAGVVVQRKTEVGSYLRVGDPLVRLIADDQLEVEANVPALYLVGLGKGTLIKAKLEDGTRFTATVRTALPVENPRTRTRPLRLVPNWPKGITRLANSQSVTLYLPVGKARKVVTVHKDAIVNKQGRNVVFVVRSGKAEARTVKLGVANGTRLEVLAGLKAGDVTVIRGNERLRTGAQVKVVKGS